LPEDISLSAPLSPSLLSSSFSFPISKSTAAKKTIPYGGGDLVWQYHENTSSDLGYGGLMCFQNPYEYFPLLATHTQVHWRRTAFFGIILFSSWGFYMSASIIGGLHGSASKSKIKILRLVGDGELGERAIYIVTTTEV
jgi:hypothetical protein